jgi:NTE family protein
MADQGFRPPHNGANESETAHSLHRFGQVVLVLQGGGALGAYHGGVYEALHLAGVEPDWIVGTSIGAINGGLIAGNAKDVRLERIKRFWKLIEYEWPLQAARWFPFVGQSTANLLTLFGGNPEFFKPNPYAPLALQTQTEPERAAFYTVEPLRQTLHSLIDADMFSRWPTRLTVGAAKVTTSEMVYFDSAEIPLRVDHIIASGALPPAFPPVRIDGTLYWDGGIVSNTPLDIVLEEHRRRPVLVIEVQLWDADGPEPRTIMEGLMREKDIRFSSRAEASIMRAKELHRVRMMVSRLLKRLPPEDMVEPELLRIASEGMDEVMHVVRLLAPRLSYDDQTKDIDFSQDGIAQRWAAGLRDMTEVLKAEPWNICGDEMEGIVLHEAHAGEVMETR